MSIPSRQIGWSQESNLLWQVSKEIDTLTGVTSTGISNIISLLNTKITNEQGVPSFYADTFVNIPAPGEAGRIFVSTDTYAFYRDNGSGWDLIGGPGTGTITGSGTIGKYSLFSGSSVIGDGSLTEGVSKITSSKEFEATKLITTGGTSTQILSADGSVITAGTNITISGGTISAGGGNTIYTGDGTLTSNRTLTLGGFSLTFDGSRTATGAIARGLHLNNTLVAAANNDVLVGLDIKPIFSNGAFTGITNYAARIENSVSATATTLRLVNNATGSQLTGPIIDFYSTEGAGQIIPLAQIITQCGSSGFYNRFGINVRGNRMLTLYQDNKMSIGVTNPNLSGPTDNLIISGSGASTTLGLAGNSGDVALGRIESNNDVAGGSSLRFSNTTSSAVTEKFRIFSTGNVLVQTGGTFTDAGFKLDVNGTARVSGDLTILNNKLVVQNISNNTAPTMMSFINTGSGGGTGATFQFSYSSTLALTFGNGFTFTHNGTSTPTRITSAGISTSGNINLNTTLTFDSTVSATIKSNTEATNPFTYIGGGSLLFQNYIGGSYDTRFAILRSTGNVVIQNGGTFTDVASARLQVNSTTQGFLPPRMTTTQKNAIATPAAGLIVYDTDTNKLCCYNGTTWNDLF